VAGKCQSCGLVSALDNAHKFAGYIIKNPPKNSGIVDKDDEVKKKETG
jgi:translation initiation factor 5